MMDERQIEGHLREWVGDPDVDVVSKRKLIGSYFHNALTWLAGELGLNVRTQASLYTLLADTYAYPLPRNTYEVIWVEWNDRRLERATLYGWNRDAVDYRGAESGYPTEWCIIGSEIIFNPPPSSGAISTDASVDMCFIEGGLELGPDGVPGFTDLDTWCAIHRAAQMYLDMHPTQENVARSKSNRAEWEMRLPECRRVHQKRGALPAAKLNVWSARER